MVSLERQQKTKENLYIYLLQKQEENSLLQSFSTENIRVLALASGILIPIMILIINNIFNTTIKNKDDLIDLDIPYLESLPFLKFEKNIPIVVNEGKRDTINESFRTLRANPHILSIIIKGLLQKKYKVKLITSNTKGYMNLSK